MVSFDAQNKLMAMLEEYREMEPGEDRDKFWEEIQVVMGEAADELHEIAQQRPSGYILAEQLKEQNTKFLDEMDKRVKPPTFWQLLFGRKKR